MKKKEFIDFADEFEKKPTPQEEPKVKIDSEGAIKARKNAHQLKLRK